MLNEYLIQINALKNDLDEIEKLIKLEDLEEKIREMEFRFNYEGWTDIEALQEYHEVINKRDSYINLLNRWQDLKDLVELLLEEPEVDMIDDVKKNYNVLLNDITEMKISNMFVEKYDHSNVLMSIHAGAGGKEAQDWAGMLYRMYLRWADKHNFKVNILDYQEGDDPKVLKSATIEIKGKNVYGMLKNENGVHRLVRVSPFDSQKRRHTSFAAIEVIPEITQDTTIEIDPKDIRIDKYRASGAGGQHVNMTDSAVRITHLPTGIVVTCQNERSQYQNKESAMKVLISKLVKIKEQEHLDTIADITGEQRFIEWGSQIRSYIFMPYQMVKDHRTNYETSNIISVMNGNIDEFIFKSLANN